MQISTSHPKRRLFQGILIAAVSMAPALLTQPLVQSLATGANTNVIAQSCGSANIGSDFNGTRINGGSYIWFNANFKPGGIGSGATTVSFTNQHIQFSANGTNYNVPVPDAQVTFNDPTVGAPQTSFNTSANRWETRLPGGPNDDTFISGLAFPVPAGGLPGGVKPVAWTGTFGGNGNATPSNLNWKWGAAVYTNFTTDYNALGVKPSHGYGGSEMAGTPLNYKSSVVGGARGGGGSNYTGSWSSTGSVSCFAQPTPTPVPTNTPVPPTPTPTPVSICGNVYNDLNANGQIDPGEPKLSGVTITLLDGSGNALATTTTDANGHYCFTGLPAGTYMVMETDLPGYVSTNAIPGPSAVKNNVNKITVTATTPGTTYQPNDFLDTLPAPPTPTPAPTNTPQPKSEICAFVYNDLNANGQQDAGEPPIAGVTVTLQDSAGHTNVGTTDAKGGFCWFGLDLGMYTVTETDLPGYVSTNAIPGPGGVKNNVNQITVNVTALGTNYTPQTFLDTQAKPTPTPTPAPTSTPLPKSEICAFVYNDLNANGQQDAGEPPIAGVTVTLQDSAGHTSVGTTDSKGGFCWFGSALGTYTVIETIPPSYTGTNAIPGPGGTKSSISQITVNVTALGTNYTPQTFLVTQAKPTPTPTPIGCTGSIQGVVFDDLNGNGVQDVSEPGLSGVQLVVQQNGKTVATATTDSKGFYSISLPPGSYVLYETVPSGFKATTVTAYGINLPDCSTIGINFGLQ